MNVAFSVLRARQKIPRLRSGFRLRAPASLTPAKRPTSGALRGLIAAMTPQQVSERAGAGRGSVAQAPSPAGPVCTPKVAQALDKSKEPEPPARPRVTVRRPNWL